MDFYSPNKILSLTDVNGDTPRLRFIIGNRTAGKTFGVKTILVRRFLRTGSKFVCFVRYITDIANFSDGFWRDVGPIKFKDHTMTQAPLLQGHAAELFLDSVPCGYVIAINDPERVKRNSSLFSDAEYGFLDEFVSENGKYVPGEIRKLNSICMSIGRGGASGSHTRHFEVLFCANKVTIFNPYFDYYKIASRLTPETKFLRGEGWVLEVVHNVAAEEAIRKEYGNSMTMTELNYAAGGEWLLDNNRFVKKLPGQKAPLCNIKYNGKMYGVWSCSEGVYVSRKYSAGLKAMYSFNKSDHDEETRFVPKTDKFIKSLKTTFINNACWFDSQTSREAFLAVVSMQDY